MKKDLLTLGLQVIEALFTDDDILNSFWSNIDGATENASLLLKFAFNQVRSQVVC